MLAHPLHPLLSRVLLLSRLRPFPTLRLFSESPTLDRVTAAGLAPLRQALSKAIRDSWPLPTTVRGAGERYWLARLCLTDRLTQALLKFLSSVRPVLAASTLLYGCFPTCLRAAGLHSA